MMKRKRKNFVFLMVILFVALNSFGQGATQGEKEAVISWIQKNAIPISSVEAGNDYKDLQPLKRILKDVRVVGLGEATHGTREFFQLKHRLFEFLVKEMGYTGFAMEAPYFSCQPINDYILYGKGDLYTVLTGQGYVVWDTEEVAQLIEWMRMYNQNVPEERKIKFYGLDLAYQENGRKEVLKYLKRVAPERLSHTDSLFEILASEEKKWPMQKDEAFEKTMMHILPSIQYLTDYLEVRKEELVKKSSLQDFDQARHNLRVMKQFILANTPALNPPFIDGVMVRSLSMAENLIFLMDQAGPKAKFVVWEHNTHLAKDVWEETDLWKGSTLMGYQLRKKYGYKYYVFALEVNRGSFQTRTSISPTLLGEMKSIALPPAPEGSWPWYLSQVNVDKILLDFRSPTFPSEVEAWVNSPQQIFLTGWVHDPQRTYVELEVGRLYDGIIYIHTTSPSTPTENAVKRAGRGEGL